MVNTNMNERKKALLTRAHYLLDRAEQLLKDAYEHHLKYGKR